MVLFYLINLLLWLEGFMVTDLRIYFVNLDLSTVYLEIVKFLLNVTFEIIYFMLQFSFECESPTQAFNILIYPHLASRFHPLHVGSGCCSLFSFITQI